MPKRIAISGYVTSDIAEKITLFASLTRLSKARAIELLIVAGIEKLEVDKALGLADDVGFFDIQPKLPIEIPMPADGIDRNQSY